MLSQLRAVWDQVDTQGYTALPLISPLILTLQSRFDYGEVIISLRLLFFLLVNSDSFIPHQPSAQ
jgi:hypothetical protein